MRKKAIHALRWLLDNGLAPENTERSKDDYRVIRFLFDGFILEIQYDWEWEDGDTWNQKDMDDYEIHIEKITITEDESEVEWSLDLDDNIVRLAQNVIMSETVGEKNRHYKPIDFFPLTMRANLSKTSRDEINSLEYAHNLSLHTVLDISVVMEETAIHRVYNAVNEYFNNYREYKERWENHG